MSAKKKISWILGWGVTVAEGIVSALEGVPEEVVSELKCG